MWINDTQVIFEGGLKRGSNPTDTYYDEVDIAPFLKYGENTISVLVWYFGKNGFSQVNSGRAALFFDCNTPGINLDSNNSWSCAVYPAYETADAPFPNFRLSKSSIRFDANKEMVDWYKSGYNGHCRVRSKWQRLRDIRLENYKSVLSRIGKTPGLSIIFRYVMIQSSANFPTIVRLRPYEQLKGMS